MTARAKPAQVSSRSYFKFLEDRIRSKDERTLHVSALSSSSHVWLPDGPIHRYLMEHALDDFLDSDSSQTEETLEFAQGLVTEAALAQLRLELGRLRARMAALHEESMAAPLEQRRGIGVVLALRRWDPEGFKRM